MNKENRSFNPFNQVFGFNNELKELGFWYSANKF